MAIQTAIQKETQTAHPTEIPTVTRKAIQKAIQPATPAVKTKSIPTEPQTVHTTEDLTATH